MFREEQFVEINGTRVSRNGFKNLSFETSRFSDGIDAIRGFGSVLNERNLNIVDTISVDFLIDYKELEEFALVYSMFKAIGALPITNKYILDKIKSTLAYERAAYITKSKKAKTITHLIVLLERMELVSLERTDSGFSVNMILTLYRHGYSSSEYASYKKKYDAWNEETGFEAICRDAIKKEISEFKNNGNLELKIYNIEELNSSYQATALLNEGNGDSYFSEEDKENKEQEYKKRYETLSKYENIKPTVIKISAVNIAQLELITHNNIANLPLYGEPIGIKSYMGIGKSSFIAKMIFDENDNEVLSQLKGLSDLSIINHKINIKIPIVNIFDFHTATITNVFFNNVEQANGIMVTIKFEINGYDYYNPDALNLDNSLNLITNNQYEKTTNMTTYFLENALQEMERSKNHNIRNKIIDLYNSVIATEVTNTQGEETAEGGSKSDVVTSRFRLYDFLTIYTSGMSCYFLPHTVEHDDSNDLIGTVRFKDAELKSDINNIYSKETPTDKEKITIKNKFYNSIINTKYDYDSYQKSLDRPNFSGEQVLYNNAMSIKELDFSFHEIQLTNIYKFFDALGILNIYGSQKIKEEIKKVFAIDYIKYGASQVGAPGAIPDMWIYEGFNKNVVYDFVNALYSEKFNSNEGMVFNRMLYMNLIYDLIHISTSSIEKEVESIKSESYITGNGDIRYKKIKNDIEIIFNKMSGDFLSRLENNNFIKECVRLTRIELSERTEYEFENYTDSSLEGVLEDHIRSVVSNIKNDFAVSSKKIINQINLIVLSKVTLAYGNLLGGKYNDVYNNIVSLDKLIKTNIISASVLGLFLPREKNRTDILGQLFENVSNNIGTKLGEYYYILKQSEKVQGEYSDYDFFKNYFNENINSEKQDEVRTGIWLDTEHDNVNTLKKDFLYFYKNKIKSLDVEEMIWSFDTMKTKNEAFDFMDNFLEDKKNKFSLGEIYHEKQEYHLDYSKLKGLIVPSYFKQTFHNVDNKINPIMRKRILGTKDPFMDMKKISNLVSGISRDIIPDYDIKVFVANYKGNGSGPFSKIQFDTSFSLSDVASVRISKDPVTKIKTAKIVVLDLDKKLINKDKFGSSISFKVTLDGQIEFYTIEAGDDITIDLGYGPNKHNEFRGSIASIQHYGNMFEINCVGLAATLYSKQISEITAGKTSIVKKTISFIHSAFKNMSRSSDKIDKSLFNSMFSEKNCNNHLFNIFTENNNEVFKDGEDASMYNVTVMLLATLTQSVKNKFSQSMVNSASAFYKKTIEATKSVFGTVDESAPVSQSGNVSFFKNIYNVDLDYDTYGFSYYKLVKNSDSSSLEKDQGYTKAEAEEGKVEENVTIAKDTSGTAKFIWPCASERITSPFGKTREIERYDANGKRYIDTSVHKGIDVGPIKRSGKIYDEDNVIWASANGKITTAHFSKSAGNFVIIKHDDGMQTMYAHLKKFNPKTTVGRIIKQGEEIGIMGNTTKTVVNMATHLHFELIKNGTKLDPHGILKGDYNG